ncbi:MAG: response regulator [Candidatus Latescibacteria bacterium]|jgi:CheY-like chemotaxis protein|nr:response regulator [Candidatus Latescibacterota bacterium]
MTSKSKILLIDDDRDFLASVRSVLESHGYTVVEAETGKDGLQKLIEHKPDVIILDIMMESLTEGYSVNYAIKHLDDYKEYKRTPIIMVSSIESSPDERFPISDGYVDVISPNYYMNKPLDIPAFLDVLEKVIQE